nr:MAG TPA: hypothetical protein [Caudoviricetes sp.]
MSTYTPKRKGENGEMEEIKFPWAVLANPPTIPSKTSQLTNDSGFTANNGTVTSVGIKMNGVLKGTVTESGVVDLGTVITQHQNLPIKSASLSGTTLYLTL